MNKQGRPLSRCACHCTRVPRASFRTLALPQHGIVAVPTCQVRAPCPALPCPVCSVVPVYPPEGSDVIRAGSLPGEPSPRVPETQARLPRLPASAPSVRPQPQQQLLERCGAHALSCAPRLAWRPVPRLRAPAACPLPSHSPCPAPQPSRFISRFDINGDNALGFDEFLLFQTLLSIPMDDLEVAFRLMDKGARHDPPPPTHAAPGPHLPPKPFKPVCCGLAYRG